MVGCADQRIRDSAVHLTGTQPHRLPIRGVRICKYIRIESFSLSTLRVARTFARILITLHSSIELKLCVMRRRKGERKIRGSQTLLEFKILP
jgi:hypothetical protein